MKKFFVAVLLVVFTMGVAGVGLAGSDPPGPAPNSGDGIPDGSGMDGRTGPNAPDVPGSSSSPGPAPNSGDGESDGSGF
jgi:hypothetical protein